MSNNIESIKKRVIELLKSDISSSPNKNNSSLLEEIVSEIFKLEMEFYNNNMIDIILTLGGGFSTYSLVSENIVNYNSCEKLVFNPTNTSQIFIDIYETNTPLLYFIKKEYFNHETDEDYVNYMFIFTQHPPKEKIS